MNNENGIDLVTKTYIEKAYDTPEGKFNVVTSEVTERDPLSIEEEPGLVKFSYYECDVTTINGQEIHGEKTNTSPVYFFGKRITREEAEELAKNDEKIRRLLMPLKVFTNKDLCLTSVGKIALLKPGDMTVEEVREKTNSAENSK